MSDVFTTLQESRPQKIWDGVVGRARHGQELTLAVVELDADSVIPEHSHVNEQVGILVDGSVAFRVGSDTRELQPGASWCIPAHIPHEVRVGERGAIIIEAFAPPRDDWRALEETAPAEPRWPR
jgi:quercetin dioxygenase-like cupin family protein